MGKLKNKWVPIVYTIKVHQSNIEFLGQLCDPFRDWGCDDWRSKRCQPVLVALLLQLVSHVQGHAVRRNPSGVLDPRFRGRCQSGKSPIWLGWKHLKKMDKYDHNYAVLQDLAGIYDKIISSWWAVQPPRLWQTKIASQTESFHQFQG